MSYTFCPYADREMMMLNISNRIAGDLETALGSSDRVSLVVPGGTTPGPIFDDLCDVDLDWSRVDVMLSDERWVPEDHDRSNTLLLKRRLLVGRAAAARLVPLYRAAEHPEDVIDQLIAEVEASLPISVLLLGMGADMHTASLFPGADRLLEGLSRNAPTLLPMRAPGAPEPRITFSAPALDGALAKHIVITGLEKRDALERARDLSSEDAPVKAIWNDATIHWAE
ncbi:6-phosphogluconolactonase [Poseidonocella pacifica]|uniref:6-phosphogluconolactonase n=1 Tax=Poseidonocella pacifica TaxID=871651 RepID=UPI000A697857|nr:6-phosphogluconolactonase [Poseidonocella pacifica]